MALGAIGGPIQALMGFRERSWGNLCARCAARKPEEGQPKTDRAPPPARLHRRRDRVPLVADSSARGAHLHPNSALPLGHQPILIRAWSFWVIRHPLERRAP